MFFEEALLLREAATLRHMHEPRDFPGWHRQIEKSISQFFDSVEAKGDFPQLSRDLQAFDVRRGESSGVELSETSAGWTMKLDLVQLSRPQGWERRIIDALSSSSRRADTLQLWRSSGKYAVYSGPVGDGQERQVIHGWVNESTKIDPQGDMSDLVSSGRAIGEVLVATSFLINMALRPQ